MISAQWCLHHFYMYLVTVYLVLKVSCHIVCTPLHKDFLELQEGYCPGTDGQPTKLFFRGGYFHLPKLTVIKWLNIKKMHQST